MKNNITLKNILIPSLKDSNKKDKEVNNFMLTMFLENILETIEQYLDKNGYIIVKKNSLK